MFHETLKRRRPRASETSVRCAIRQKALSLGSYCQRGSGQSSNGEKAMNLELDDRRVQSSGPWRGPDRKQMIGAPSLVPERSHEIQIRGFAELGGRWVSLSSPAF